MEYLLNDLRYAPMTMEDGISRRVYLPKGKWHDFFDGTVYDGGQEIQVDADYDKIPVFVKDNCILPVAEPVESVKKDTVFVMHPRVYGNGQEEFVLYEDDFETFAYEDGRQNEVVLRMGECGQVQYERKGNEKVRYVFAAAQERQGMI